ncbi:MAG: helix-turn-helix domain-containing protein [Thermodesulfobacteriota bacterium]
MESDTLNINGDKIRTLREKNKVTQLYLATVVGVTTDTISRWENRRYPTIKRDNAIKLAEALQVPLEELLDGQEEALPPAEPSAPPPPETRPPEEQEQPPATPAPVVAPSPAAAPGRHLLPAGLPALLLIGFCLGLAALTWRYLAGPDTSRLTATRFLPRHVLTGQVFPVLIEVSAGEAKPATLMLRENLPAPCVPLVASPPFLDQQEDTRLIKWISQVEANGRERFTYLAKVAADAEPGRRLAFAGNLVIGGKNGDGPTVEGDQETEIAAFHWADTNRDNRVDDYEFLAVYELFQNFVEMKSTLAELERIWSAGGYHWNDKRRAIEVGTGQ